VNDIELHDAGLSHIDMLENILPSVEEAAVTRAYI